MTGSLRCLVRSAVTNGWSKTRTSSIATSANFESGASLNFSRTPCRRYLRATVSRALDSPDPVPALKTSSPARDDTSWRHPRYGFALTDITRLVRMKIHRKTTKADMKLLFARAGFPDAQVMMTYMFNTGTSEPYCLVKLANEKERAAAIEALSNFTLFGQDLTVEPYDHLRFPYWNQPSLFAGWHPSPSSDTKTRVIRPLITSPPELLAPLMAEQWVHFQNLPRVDPAQKDSAFKIVHEFYKEFHQYDVIGITVPRPHHYKANGWFCRILFGSANEAAAARRAHIKSGKFMGLKAAAKIHRGGPDIHKILWNYRQSLPKDTPTEEINTLLEQKYKELIIRDRPGYQRTEHPTPESAVGLKNTESESG